ncbi:MAG: Origin recognition complex subunit 2, partial [Watsoniomyces obsoletus]
TIASAVAGEDEKLKLTGPPEEMLEILLSYLTKHLTPSQLVIMVNSIDAASLRKGAVQSILAGLSAHPLVSLIATADTPNFMLMWNSALLDQFNFAFHDCTTFAPYEAEISVVDEVYDLLGRKGRRLGGKDVMTWTFLSKTLCREMKHGTQSQAMKQRKTLALNTDCCTRKHQKSLFVPAT